MFHQNWREVTITHAHQEPLAKQVEELLRFSGFVPDISVDPSGGLPGIAASVVFDERRVILLAREEIELPDALRCAVVVRYAGETLDTKATLSLLAAINELNRRFLPRE